MAEQSDMYFCINKNILYIDNNIDSNIDSNVNNHARRFYLIKQDQQNIDDYLDQLVTSVSLECRKEFSKYGNLKKVEGGYHVSLIKAGDYRLRREVIKFYNEDLKMFLKLVYYHLYDEEHFANIQNEWKTYRKYRYDFPQINGFVFNNLNLNHVDLSDIYFCFCSFINAEFRCVDFSGLRLGYASFFHTTFRSVDFSNAIFEYNNISGTWFKKSNFLDATLIKNNFSNATFIDNNFSKIEFRVINFSNATFEGNNFSNTKFIDTNLSNTRLWHPNLSNATFTNTDFSNTSLFYTDFSNIILKDVTFNNARCEEVNFYGTDFSTSTTNEMRYTAPEYTEISTIQLTNVNLNNINISEELKSAVEYNRRKLNWEKYYDYPKISVSLIKLISIESKYIIFLLPIMILYCLFYKIYKHLRHPIKTAVNLFWWSTNYGYSTLRIFLTLSIISLIFSGIYLLGHYANNPLIELTPTINTINCDIDSQNLIKDKLALNNIQIVLRSIYFSIVTMTTLGFGDITVNPASYIGHVIVSIQVILGYIGLGALITRIGTLFNSAGLTTTPKEYNKKHKRKN